MHLIINESKTKYMEITTKSTNNWFFSANNYKFEKVMLSSNTSAH